MAKGYWIGHVTITDPERYKDYLPKVSAHVAAFGGQYLVRGGAFDVPEGNTKDRHVVIEFKDFETAKAAYADPGYAEAMAIRKSASTGDIMIIEGYDG